MTIPTLKLSFWPRRGRRECLSDFNNDRQLEVATETGNTYISGAKTDSVEVQTANSGFFNLEELVKSDCGKRRTARSGKIGAQNVYFAISGCRSLSQSPKALYSSAAWSKIPEVLLECWRYLSYTCTFGDISTSGLDSHIATSGCPSMLHLFVDTFSSLPWSKTLLLLLELP